MEQYHSPKVHSPYAFPAISVSDMCQANRTYYNGCSSSSSEAEEYDWNHEQQQNAAPETYSYSAPQQWSKPQGPPTYHQAIASPPNPPSYVQATIAAARSRTNSSPDSEVAETSSPRHTDRIANYIPEGVFHRALAKHCEFIQPPALPNYDTPTPSYPCHRLFLGQIRFETTAAEVQWLIEYLANVRALKIETRGTGCFLAYFKTWDDMCKVRGLHKRILFDHTGIWYASDADQAKILAHYVETNLAHIGRGFRLPKDMMVVEEEKLVRPLPIPPCPPQYQQLPPPVQHQYPSYHPEERRY